MGQAADIRGDIVAHLRKGPHEGNKADLAEAVGYDRNFSSFYAALRQLEKQNIVETVLGERGSYKRVQLSSPIDNVKDKQLPFIELVKVAVCDSCDTRVLPEMGTEDLHHGFVGHVFNAGEWGGCSAEFFACSEKCIKDAIVKALERAWHS